MLGSSQTWTNGSANTVTVNGTTGAGTVTGAGNNLTVANTSTGSTVINAAIQTTTGNVTNSSGTTSLSGLNTYTGVTNINAGTVNANTADVSTSAQSLGQGATVNLGVAATSSGVLNYTGGAATLDKNINALGNGSDTVRNSGSGALTLSGTVTKNGTNLTLNASTAAINVTGQIVGAAAGSDLFITGNNTATLSNNNTYNGATTVGTVAPSTTILAVTGSLSGTTGVTVNSGGTLLLNSSTAANNIINTAATFTSNGGTLAVDNTQTGRTNTFASMTLNANTTLNFGTGDTNTLLFTLPGNLNAFVTGGGILTINGWTGLSYAGQLLNPSAADTGDATQDRLIFAGDPGFGNGNFISGIQFSGFGAGATQVSFGAGQFEIVPVPEPATTALIGAVALCALIGYRERRRFTGIRSRMARK